MPRRIRLARIWSAAALIALIGCSFGCKRKRDLDGRLDELVQIRDATCACVDLECAKYQQTAYTAWNFRNDSTDSAKMTQSQRERFSTLHHQLQECLMNFSRRGTGSAN